MRGTAASQAIFVREFCLVELRGLEPLTPCLQSDVFTRDARADLARRLSVSSREVPLPTPVNGTLMTRRACWAERSRPTGRVGVHRPLEAGHRGMQVMLDRRERGVHDRAVDAEDEQAEAADAQDLRLSDIVAVTPHLELREAWAPRACSQLATSTATKTG